MSESGDNSPQSDLAPIIPIDRNQRQIEEERIKAAQERAMRVARGIRERHIPKKQPILLEVWNKLQETHFPRKVLTMMGIVTAITKGPDVAKTLADALRGPNAQKEFLNKLQNQLTPDSKVVFIDGQVIIRPKDTSVNIRNAPFTQPVGEENEELGKITGKIQPGQSMILDDAVLIKGQDTTQSLAGTATDQNNTWLMFAEDTNEDGIGDKLRFIAKTDQTIDAIFVDPEAQQKVANVVSADLKNAAIHLKSDKGAVFQPVGYRATFAPPTTPPPAPKS